MEYIIDDSNRNIYGNNFRAYTIKKGSGIISGLLWELNAEDLEKIKQWEFVGSWREIVEVKVESSGSKDVSALTEKSQDKYPAKDISDGLTYEEFENQRIQQQPNFAQSEYYTKQQIKKIRAWLEIQARQSK